MNNKIKYLIAIALLSSMHILFLHARATNARTKTTARPQTRRRIIQPKTTPRKAVPQKTAQTKAAVTNQPTVQSADHKDFESLLKLSNLFDTTIGKFPTKENRIAEIAGNDIDVQQRIAVHARHTYPLLHEDVQAFLDKFLQFKKQNGTDKEKALYASMTSEQLIVRLLEQRPLMFMEKADRYLLRGDRKQGFGGFEKIGTESEQSPLILKDYLSYDEMGLAALLGVSSPTYFINNGARDNRSIKMQPGTFQIAGVYVGLVGARFEKPGYMEWQHMVITPQQNVAAKGYGLTASDQGLLALWSDLYGEKFPTFNEAQQDKTGRYVLLDNGFYFDTAVYKQRIRLVVEPFLRDAQTRATASGRKAYVHVVGLGLGVWQIDKRQAQWMLEVYADIINDNDLSAISDIDFSWFAPTAQKVAGVSDGGQLKNIIIHFSQRNPADKLIGNDAGKLLVACYAWDGNAYPGNEYWAGMLDASGDPAAACCSTIAELQNPKINPYIKENIKKVMIPVVQQKKSSNTNAKKAAQSAQLSWWDKMKLTVKSKVNYWKQNYWKKD